MLSWVHGALLSFTDLSGLLLNELPYELSNMFIKSLLTLIKSFQFSSYSTDIE